MFIDKLDVKELQKAIAEGRQVYEWKTEDPHQLPIYGPAYDDHPSLNRAKREGRYAATLAEAREAARKLNTDISAALFLTE